MSKFKFVGFQDQVEVPEGFQPFELIESIASKLDKDSLFGYISDPMKISQWFFSMSELDGRPGGKFLCTDQDGQPFEGRCTSIALGKEISLLAQPFGQLHAKVTSTPTGSAIEIRFQNLTDSESSLSAQYKDFLQRLRALVQ